MAVRTSYCRECVFVFRDAVVDERAVVVTRVEGGVTGPGKGESGVVSREMPPCDFREPLRWMVRGAGRGNEELLGRQLLSGW